jgi:hypothetical protein
MSRFVTKALCEILEEWNRCDLNYSQRIKLPSSGIYGLNSSTVFNDGARNQMTGSAGDDWFFAGNNDKITDGKNFRGRHNNLDVD